MKPVVLVFYGGKSPEHEVSQRSALFVLRNLDRSKYTVHSVGIDKDGTWWPQNTDENLAGAGKSVPIKKDPSGMIRSSQANDPVKSIFTDIAGVLEGRPVRIEEIVVFPVIHGSFGEDGNFQGFLEMAEIAYVGCGLMGAGIGMDKAIAKKLAEGAGVPVVPYLETRKQFWAALKDELLESVDRSFGYPVFVKPSRLGSSVGISKVERREDFVKACESAFEFDDKILIEKGLKVKELECAALGDYNPKLSLVGEVVAHDQFYTYDAKYVSHTGASIAVPAQIEPGIAKQIQEYSRKIYMALDLYGMSRIDFFLETGTNLIYFNEVNTVPGFTEVSQYPMLWKASGVDASALLDELIKFAVSRRANENALKRSI